MLKFPSIFFNDDIQEESKEELSKIITSHGGTVTDIKENASHVIVPPVEQETLIVDGKEVPKDAEFLRTLQKRGEFVLIHWWYYPDSYDTWLTVSDIAGEAPETQPPHVGQWNVSSGWLRDLDKFNEFMNENDYVPSAISGKKQIRVPILNEDEEMVSTDSTDEEPPRKKQRTEPYEHTKLV